MRPVPTVSLISALVLVSACESDPVRPVPAERRFDLRAAAWTEPTQTPADEISANIQALHLPADLPAPTIIDPRFASGDTADKVAYTTLVGYAHAGDAAIWTGHYLAAEAFRYWVTKSPEALANANRALAGIQGLVDVTTDAMPTNPGLLARFLWPDTWWYAGQMAQQEGGHGVYAGTAAGVPHHWIGNTSRDQYSGVFFGLAVAYDAFGEIPDAKERARQQRQIRILVTRMLNFLLRNGWNVPMPDGSFSTTFFGRPDQQLALLQIGRHVNPNRFELTYQAHRAAHAANVITPMAVECQDQHRSYYKFNLDHINLYNLIRLEADGVALPLYRNAFATLRGCTASHENAHFNMIERGVTGPDAARDSATKEYLGLWLQRPRRDYYVDLTGQYPQCTHLLPECAPDEAGAVIPVDKRVNTDFLWQRSPFLLYWDHRGDGTIEFAGIDYLLPYWMARHYGVLPGTVSP